MCFAVPAALKGGGPDYPVVSCPSVSASTDDFLQICLDTLRGIQHTTNCVRLFNPKTEAEISQNYKLIRDLKQQVIMFKTEWLEKTTEFTPIERNGKIYLKSQEIFEDLCNSLCISSTNRTGKKRKASEEKSDAEKKKKGQLPDNVRVYKPLAWQFDRYARELTNLSERAVRALRDRGASISIGEVSEEMNRQNVQKEIFTKNELIELLRFGGYSVNDEVDIINLIKKIKIFGERNDPVYSSSPAKISVRSNSDGTLKLLYRQIPFDELLRYIELQKLNTLLFNGDRYELTDRLRSCKPQTGGLVAQVRTLPNEGYYELIQRTPKGYKCHYFQVMLVGKLRVYYPRLPKPDEEYNSSLHFFKDTLKLEAIATRDSILPIACLQPKLNCG